MNTNFYCLNGTQLVSNYDLTGDVASETTDTEQMSYSSTFDDRQLYGYEARELAGVM